MACGFQSIVTSPEAQIVEFGGFSLDTGQRRLRDVDGKLISLHSRAFDTLLYLLEHPGELLDKDTLMRAVWPNVIVEENNLNQAVSALRRALGEGHITTIPGRGYQFVTPVKRLTVIPETGPVKEPISGTDASQEPGLKPDTVSLVATGRTIARKPSHWLWAGATVFAVLLLAVVVGRWDRATPQRIEEQTITLADNPPNTTEQTPVAAAEPSIAVLPFADMSPNNDQAYFADGLAEELINQLVQIPGLLVIGRTSSFSFKGKNADLRTIGQTLGVNHILEGSVRKAGNQLRITAQLTDAQSGTHEWSQTYDRSFDDVFAIQTDIALKVADALRAEFSPEEAAVIIKAPTDSTEAYNLYLAAKADLERFGTENILMGIDKIDHALELDPEFVQGWVLKSSLYRRLPVFVPERAEEGRIVGEAAARRAIELAPESIETREVLGIMLTELGRWRDAEAEFRKIPEAARLTSFSYSWQLFLTGHARMGIQGMQVDLQRDPLDLELWAFYISFLDTLGDTQGALETYRRGAALFPEWGFGRYHLVQTLLGSGDIERLPKLLENAAPITQLLLVLLESPGTAAEGLQALVDTGSYSTFEDRTYLAMWAAYLKRPDIALTLLAQLAREVPATAYMFWRPVFASVRRDDGFKTLVTETGHVAFWREYGWTDLCKPVGADDFECS